MQPHLFCFGLGYSSLTLAEKLLEEGWRISGTCRTQEKCEQLHSKGITAYVFDTDLPLAMPETYLAGVTHILDSIPPNDSGDIVLRHHLPHIQMVSTLEWVGIFSTTGVYGDHQGAWVDESTATNPTHQQATNRMVQEKQWMETGFPIHIFRLSGIYGPGRSAIEMLKKGTARRIHKEGQVFSRIHVQDIAQIVQKSIEQPNPQAIYNCADDLPEAQEKVVTYAAELLGIDPPPLIPFEDAELSPMGKQFYSSCRRVKNERIKKELGVKLQFPSYKEGLKGELVL